MLRKIIHCQSDIICQFPVEPVEALSAWTALLWGIVVLNPLTDSLANPAFVALTHTAPEWAWGALLASVGLARIAGACLWKPLARRVLALVSTIAWCLIAGGIILSTPFSTGVPMYALQAMSSVWVYLRLGVGEHYGS